VPWWQKKAFGVVSVLKAEKEQNLKRERYTIKVTESASWHIAKAANIQIIMPQPRVLRASFAHLAVKFSDNLFIIIYLSINILLADSV
jgi:hypothetical protein